MPGWPRHQCRERDRDRGERGRATRAATSGVNECEVKTAASFSFAAIILAAGAAARMGRPKMLLPWGTTTVLGHLIAQWQRIGAAQTVVVCAASDTAIKAELDRIDFAPLHRIVNPEPGRGM